jgi:hypothetical protein
MDLNNPARGEPVHKIFMDKVPNDTNQGTPSQGDSCAFPFFGNIGVPLMATLYIHVSSSAKSSPPPSIASGESTVTSNRKSKLNRKKEEE